MIYLYDIIVDEDTRELTYLGDEYLLNNVTKKGQSVYMNYTADGLESMIVVPGFAREFLECCQKVEKFKKVTTNTAVKAQIEARFNTKAKVEIFDSGTSKLYSYAVDYKHIRFTLELANGHMSLKPDFTIVSGNIFGNMISVDVRDNPELYKYCED